MPTDETAAQRAERAFQQLKSGDAPAAIAELRALSEQGFAPAEALLGWAYETGHGGPSKVGDAERWYLAAANRGDPLGRYYLGVLLLRRRDFDRAIGWIHMAAEQGYTPAIYRLALLNESGVGTERDTESCRRLMTVAASRGHPFAQRWLAVRDVRGDNGLRGRLRGLFWFLLLPTRVVRIAWRPPLDENMIHP